MLKDILNNSSSFYEILENISSKKVSEKYFVVFPDNKKVEASKSENIKINQIFDKSGDDVDKFLELLKADDGIYSTMIQRKSVEKKTLPKLLNTVGYIIDPTEKDNISRMYIPRDNIEKRLKIVLNKSLKNNVLLVGHPGSGKTTIVEQFAKRNNITNLFVVETAKLVGDSQYRGQFEQRVVDIIDFAVKENLILFFDELHALIDLGNSMGGMSITDILKPYLTNNKIKFIGATTEKESKILTQDEAFKRRFSIIRVQEFSKEELLLLKKSFLETFNIKNTSFNDEKTLNVLTDLELKLPHQYFPDKFVDFLDYYSSFSQIDASTSLEDVLEEYIQDNQ